MEQLKTDTLENVVTEIPGDPSEELRGQVLDGKKAAAEIKRELSLRVGALKARGVEPGLGTVLVGDDPASHSYVAGKHRDCAEVGINSIRRGLPADISQDELEKILDELNEDPATSGYIVQLPLPPHIDQNAILERISPSKDADGLHPTNLGKLVLNVNDDPTSPLPCTPLGIIELLRRNGISLAGKEVLVLGRGVTVGRPLGLLLTRRSVNATVTLAHTGTSNLPALLARADVVVAAVGVPGVVKASQLKPGAIVLDVGVSRVVDAETGKVSLKGDVENAAADVAEWISPNPGGVGPMTRAMLISNVVDAAERTLAG